MKFLYFVYEKDSIFEDVFLTTISQSNLYIDKYVDKHVAQFVSKEIETTVVRQHEIFHNEHSFFRYYMSELNLNPDFKYWHEEDEVAEIKSKLKNPIILLLHYYKIELIGSILNNLIAEVLNKKISTQDVFFSDDGGDLLMDLAHFIERYKKQEMFFFWEG